MRVLLFAVALMTLSACQRESAPAQAESSTTQVPGPATRPPPTSAAVALSPTSGSTARGQLTVRIEGDDLRIVGAVSGLEPNSVHGIHIHETGDCSAPDASSAGGHFDPLGHPHGPAGLNSHAGDLGNITANEQGVAQVDVRAVLATLNSRAPTDVFGRAIIVHANGDDLQSQPSGRSGARIACGVIA